MCNLAETASAEEELLHELTIRAEERLCRFDGQVENSYKIKISDFTKEPLAIRRRLIQQLVSKISHGTTLLFQHIEAVLELIDRNVTGSSLNLPDRCVAKISYGFFYLSKKTEKFLTSHGTIEDTPYTISAYAADSLEGEDSFSKNRIYCDAASCGTELIVRYRRAGDRIRFETGSKKLKDFFVDSKVERSSRDRVPLVVNSHTGDIIWVAGLRQTAVALADKDTKQYIILSYDKGEE